MSNENTPSVHIMRSQLGRARGLGAAKSGQHHWWSQRVTAMALLPLSLYFVLSVLMLAGADRAQMAAYIGEPWNTVLFLCLIAALFSHLSLGLQVVVEDYVRNDAKRIITLLVLKGGIAVLALACAVSVLKLAF
ncbi:succinate dehydrogenase, hydrophobic membrane anchor protein [Acidocella sp.]|uniref:succinate dehydrogenase, hydrophobic membrane anchor protein n=1 Tax=Acidocella sp. TaxID=50710 RepID=UPI002630DEF2|nr:succinate dehydrogenase, hydrophobic membrane anchor protein [Acidocella sp.]MDD2794720.1 succinate dehydrogenase, hydrophobic membrane anchor protein [Acidocella sp.]